MTNTNIRRLDDFDRVPAKQWREGRPRITQRTIGYSRFKHIMESPDLVAVVVLDLRQVMEGDMLSEDRSVRNVGDYELIFRDDVTGGLERRTACDVEDVTARVALEKRLDLLSTERVYFNPNLIGQVFKKGEYIEIAPHFNDGAHADESIKLPIPHYIMKMTLERKDYTFDGPRISGRPATPPRRRTASEEHAYLIEQARMPLQKVEW